MIGKDKELISIAFRVAKLVVQPDGGFDVWFTAPSNFFINSFKPFLICSSVQLTSSISESIRVVFKGSLDVSFLASVCNEA